MDKGVDIVYAKSILACLKRLHSILTQLKMKISLTLILIFILKKRAGIFIASDNPVLKLMHAEAKCRKVGKKKFGDNKKVEL